MCLKCIYRVLTAISKNSNSKKLTMLVLSTKKRLMASLAMAYGKQRN